MASGCKCPTGFPSHITSKGKPLEQGYKFPTFWIDRAIFNVVPRKLFSLYEYWTRLDNLVTLVNQQTLNNLFSVCRLTSVASNTAESLVLWDVLL